MTAHLLLASQPRHLALKHSDKETRPIGGPTCNAKHQFLRQSAARLGLSLLLALASNHLAHADGPTDSEMGETRLKLGGELRSRLDLSFHDTNNSGRRETLSRLSFDTLVITENLTSDQITSSAQYQFFGYYYPYDTKDYRRVFGEVSFLKFAWLGWTEENNTKIIFGIHQIPFGLQPLLSSTYNGTIGYYIGLEDVYDFGLSYNYIGDDIIFRFGFFPRDGGNYFGASRDSTRYSVNLVKQDTPGGGGTDSSENNVGVINVAYAWTDNDNSTTLGVSSMASQIHNFDTAKTGSRWAAAIYYSGTYGDLGVSAQVARQDINPASQQDNRVVTVGSFDGSYNIATKGTLYTLDIRHSIDDIPNIAKAITPYISYSLFNKDASFSDSQRIIVGITGSVADYVNLYLEYRIAMNDNFTGSSNYLNGLAGGGTNKWGSMIYANAALPF